MIGQFGVPMRLTQITYTSVVTYFQADNATIRVAAELWKDDTRETGPQYYSHYLGSMMQIYFLDNVHYSGGITDEERFDALMDAERKWCANASYGKEQYICRNHKVLEKNNLCYR